MRTLSDLAGRDYWPEFQESSARVIIGKARDQKDKTFRQFASEPTALHFLFESLTGVNFRDIDSEKTVTTLFKGINAFREKFKIEEFSRAGVRFICLGRIPNNAQSLLPKFESLYDKNLFQLITETMGEVSDLAFVMEGGATSKLKYQFRMGPYSKDEAGKYFTEDTAKEISEIHNDANFVADIDFSEKDFAMTVRANQWCKEPIDKAQKLLVQVERLLVEGK
jgi:hypothetical protein